MHNHTNQHMLHSRCQSHMETGYLRRFEAPVAQSLSIESSMKTLNRMCLLANDAYLRVHTVDLKGSMRPKNTSCIDVSLHTDMAKDHLLPNVAPVLLQRIRSCSLMLTLRVVRFCSLACGCW